MIKALDTPRILSFQNPIFFHPAEDDHAGETLFIVDPESEKWNKEELGACQKRESSSISAATPLLTRTQIFLKDLICTKMIDFKKFLR
jgi:hypothetical protein